MGKYDHIELPALTVLNYSGGKQSSALLWMVLRGDLQVDKSRFLVLNANPGMENSKTYEYVAMMFDKCKEAGIRAVTVDGPNLYEDLLELKSTRKTRFDNPPYWTKNRETGKKGRLVQKCTFKYKIAPMDRHLRVVLEEMYGIGRRVTRIPKNLVQKWIGFSYSEVTRVKPSKQKYIYFRYPLIEMKMHNEDVIAYFVKNNLPIPPRSVCDACFANGLAYLEDMYWNRPSDWKKAVAVDNSVRDWTQIHVKDEVYVSSTLIPLETLAENKFQIKDDMGENIENDYSCDSGYCFA
jgi:hypothetical protein